MTPGKTYNLHYGYDLSGALTSEVYPSGRQIATQYDAVGRVAKIVGGLGGQQSTYMGWIAYAPHGGVALMAMGNNVWRSFAYNSRLQTRQITDLVNNELGQILLDQNLDWGSSNNNGNLNAVYTNYGGPGYPEFLTFHDYYWYDGVNRILVANGKKPANDGSEQLLWAENYGYDRYGNRWVASTGGLPASSLTPTTNVYNNANQMNAGVYDPAGNQTQFGANTLAYDAENHVTDARELPVAGGRHTQYVYDGDGRRVMKIADGGATQTYVYDIFGTLVAEYSSQPSTTPPPCSTCYISTDHLGNTRLVTDANHVVVARHDYTPFGEEIPGGYAGRGTEWGGYDAVNQKFTAKERDAETGLDYFGARYMSSAQGRFTSPDGPLLDQSSNEPQSWNIYAYGRNNPLRFTDPTGTTTCDANGNNCHDSITVTDKASGLSTIDAFLYRFLFAVVQPTLQIGQQGFDWLGKPRNGTCLASSTSAGASAGAGVGMLGLVGGPAVGISEPTAMAMGGGLGWVGGMISCMSSSGTGGGSREPEESANSGKDVERKIKQFTKKSLSEQKSIYKNLKNTYVKHLQKYGQTAGNTSGETNRMERELEQMKTILQSRGQSVD